jgi:hypothetical protein
LDHEISSHHIDIEGGEIRFAVDHGIVGSCDQCKFSNIKIHDNGLGSGLHGIYLYGDRSTVNGCQIYRNSDKAFRNGNAMNLTFSNNMIFENGRIRPNGYSVEAGRMDGRFTNNVFAQNRNGGLWIFGSTIASGNTFRDNSGRGLEITYAEDSKLFTDKTYYSNVLSNVFKNNGFLNGLSDLKIGQEAFPLDENCEPKEPRAPREPIELNSLIQNNRFIGASTLENKNCFNVPTGTILGAPWLLSYDKGIVIPADIRVNGLVSPYQSYLLDTYDDENSISVSKPFELSFTQPIGNHSTEWLILAEPLVKPGEGSVQPTVNPSFSRITHNPTDPDTAMIEFKRPGAYLMRVLVKKLSDGTMLSQVFGVNFIPKSTKVAGFDRIRLQAEHMQTAHFEIAPSSKFSSGDYIQTTGETGESHDEVYSIFPGDDGLYKVNIGYFDIGCVDALGLRANCTKDHERAKGRLNFLRFRGELTPSNRSFNWVLDADAGSVLGDQPGRQNRELGFVNLKKGDWIGIDGFDTSNGYKFDNSTPPKKITIEKFNLDYIDLIKQP